MSEADSNPRSTETQSQAAVPDISAEPTTNWVDWVVVAAVVAVALWYLYRKLWARRGDCSGCAKGKSGCAVQQASRRAQAKGAVQVPVDHLHRGK
jgi:ABC-type nickel/cobalt efflux system permease component RcnA